MNLNNASAAAIGELLKQKKHTISIAESTTGGLIAASLLAVPGASAYFQGAAVIYTQASRLAFLDLPESVRELQPLSEPMAAAFAKSAREKLNTTWGISELGIAGPTGSRYGHDAGTSVIAISGPVDKTVTVNTGSADRAANMEAFADAALSLLLEAVESA